MTTESGSTRKAQALMAKIIEALQPNPTSAYRVPDMRCKGLSIRVATNGRKTWSVAFRIKGAGVRRVSLGRCEDIGSRARAKGRTT